MTAPLGHDVMVVVVVATVLIMIMMMTTTMLLLLLCVCVCGYSVSLSAMAHLLWSQLARPPVLTENTTADVLLHWLSSTTTTR